MMKKMVENNVAKYFELAEQKKNIEAQMDTLKGALLVELADGKSVVGDYIATVTTRESVKVVDFQAVKDYLEMAGLTSTYIEEKVKTTFNKFYKELSQEVRDILGGAVSVETSKSITIKEAK
jgi:hypothetical protein